MAWRFNRPPLRRTRHLVPILVHHLAVSAYDVRDTGRAGLGVIVQLDDGGKPDSPMPGWAAVNLRGEWIAYGLPTGIDAEDALLEDRR